MEREKTEKRKDGLRDGEDGKGEAACQIVGCATDDVGRQGLLIHSPFGPLAFGF